MSTWKLIACGVVGAAGLTLAGAAPAIATVAPQVCGDVGCTPPNVPNQPQSGPLTHDPGTTAATVSTSSSSLAFTGADVAGMTLFAFGAVAAGSALRYGSRRASRRSAS